MVAIIENSEEEIDFNAWIDSVNFVDKDGQTLITVLSQDTSDDPEGDSE